MITFNPGPSQLSDRIKEGITELSHSGILSISHRSQDFKDLCKKALEGLRESLQIPEEAIIVFQSSATAAMETLLRNLVRKKSFHFVDGAFAERFLQTAQEIGLETEFASSQSPMTNLAKDFECIAITHNETSTGLMWPWEKIKEVRESCPEALLAIDITSSIGGMLCPWHLGDVWFASVQKCLGLPSGLGLLILMPQALKKIHTEHVPAYQNLHILCEKIQQYQTIETPNIFSIALLAKQMEHWDIRAIECSLREKHESLISSSLEWTPYIQESMWRSLTIANMQTPHVSSFHKKAKAAGFIIGEGYGALKTQCVRLACFPSIPISAYQKLIKALL